MAWSDLTERQKQLDRLIEGCGVRLDSSDLCVERVAKAIGATTSEIPYVRERIELRLRTDALLDKTDLFIANTERLLEQLERESEEWRNSRK